jgi:predicted small secreted protein
VLDGEIQRLRRFRFNASRSSSLEGHQVNLRNIVRTLTLVATLAASGLQMGCHTTAGAGEDIARSGEAIQRSATRNLP